MRVPLKALEGDREKIEKFLGERLRVVGHGPNKTAKVVFRKEQWKRLSETVEKNNIQLSEASSLIVRAYGRILAHGNSAKATPAGRMALIAAILSLHGADPSMASNLAFFLD